MNYASYAKQIANILTCNYATQQTPTLDDVKQRVLQIVRDYDKITSDKVLMCFVFCSFFLPAFFLSLSMGRT